MRTATTRKTTSKPDPHTAGDDPYSHAFLTGRIAGQYGARFMAIGVMTAYWPIWLESHGLSSEEIGLLSATATYAATFGGLIVAHLVDRHGRGRGPAVVLAVALLACFPPFFAAHGFWPLLLVSVPFAVVTLSIGTVTEAIAIGHARRAGLDYGRMRLWGSMSFILTAVGGGALLQDLGEDAILRLTLAGLLGVVRWGVTAETTDVAPLAFAQLLHAATFGATHLAAIRFIGAAAPGRLAVTAQAVYFAMSISLGIGTMKWLAGAAYPALEGRVYWLAAAACGAAAPVALLLLRPHESVIRSC